MRVPQPPGWPGLASFPVEIGGVTVTVTEAASAAAVLSASKSSAIRALLRGAGSPLAGCDYWAAAAPYLAAARAGIAPTGQRGCAGRHVAKTAFCEAVCAAVDGARAGFVSSALASFTADERYAAAMAADAVDIRRRAHAARVREQLRLAVDGAVRACRSQAGQFTCTTAAACGTGDCRFASGQFPGVIPAPPGRRPRPANHAAGGTFSEAPVLAAYLEDRPYKPRYEVHDADSALAGEAAA